MTKRVIPAFLAVIFSVGLIGCEQEGSLEETGEEEKAGASQQEQMQMEETGEETQSPPPQQP